MGFLNNPATYVSVADFKSMPLDYDISSYTDPQLQGMLVRASGSADAIMRKSYRAQEQTIRYLGEGTNRLEIRQAPLLYVKRLQIVFPGTTGPFIPMDQLLLDQRSGSVFEYTPMLFNGTLGYFSRFPEGIPVDITMGYGFGYTYSQPTYTTADSTGNGVTPGTYNLAITTKTMWGETPAVVKQFTTSSGVFISTINPVLGAYLYRGYVSSAANNTTLTTATTAGATSFVVGSVGTIAVGDVLLFDSGTNAEYLTVAAVNSGTLTITTTAGAAYAHSAGIKIIEQPKLVAESPFTAYGNTAMTVMVNSLQPPNGIYQDILPLTDTASPQQPDAITEAIQVLVLDGIYERNNPSNRGVYLQDSGRRRISYRSTDGNSARGVSTFMQRAMELLRPYSLQTIY